MISKYQHIIGLVVISFFCVIEFFCFGKGSISYGYGAFLETIPTHLGLLKTTSLFSNWAPFTACGVDRYAFWGNAEPISIETFLLYLFPPWVANAIHCFLTRLTGCIGSFLVAAKVFKLDKKISLIAGLSHLAFSYYTFGGMFTSALVPWLLLFLRWLCNKNKNLLWIIIGAVAFGSLTSFVHGLPYLLLFCLLWFLLCEKQKAKSFLKISVFFMFMALWDYKQIAALFANAELSARASFSFGEWNWGRLFYFQPEYDYFDQDKVLRPMILFSPVVFCSGCFLFLSSGSSHQKKMFLGSFLIFVILSQQWVFLLGQNLISLIAPFFRGVFMGRFYMVPYSFLVSMFPAFLIYFIQNKFSTRQNTNLVILLKSCLLAYLFFLVVWPKIGTLYPHAIYSFGQRNYEVDGVNFIKHTSREPFRVASVLPLQPAYAYGQGLECVDGWANLYSKYYRELWLEILEPTLMASQQARSILDPSNGKPQDNYIFLGLGLGGNADIPESHFGENSNTSFNLNKRFRLPILNLLNCRFLLSEYPVVADGYTLVEGPAFPPINQIPKDYATGVWQGENIKTLPDSWRGLMQDLKKSFLKNNTGKKIYIYKNFKFISRFYFIEKLRIFNDDKSVLRSLKSATNENVLTTAYVTKKELEKCRNIQLDFNESPNYKTGYLQMIYRSADKHRWLFSSTSPSFLSISISWSPFWKAYLNGVELPVLRVNHALMGLTLPPCKQAELTLIYQPSYAKLFGESSSILENAD